MTRSIDVSSACCDGVILYWNRNRAGGRDASHGHSSVDLFQGQVETRTTMDNRHVSHGRRGVLLSGPRRKKKKNWTLHCMQRCGASYRVCLALSSAGGGFRDGSASVEALGEPGADCRRGAPTAARCRPLQAGRCPLGDRCSSWGPYRGAGPPLKGGLARRRLARPATPGHGDFTRRHPPASTLVDSSRHPGSGQAWQGR